jgi:hypothetical protein
MRAFFAALWLVEETPTLPALQKTATDAGALEKAAAKVLEALI